MNTADAVPRREARYPCVGIALLYSAREDRTMPGMGTLLHQVATHDMSLRGMSFDVAAPLAQGAALTVLVGQPDADTCEHLLTRVCWCRELGPGQFRVGVEIEKSSQVNRKLAGQSGYESVQVGLPVPSSVELTCPACGAHTTFELVGHQSVAERAGLMPLYDCAACETTRSIMSLLAYARQKVIRLPAAGMS